LKQHQDNLPFQIQIGLRYYNEFQERIPRSEVELLEAVVKREAKIMDRHLKVMAVGSYRRGKETCGDVDILITHKKGFLVDGMLPRLINILHGTNFITDDLTTSWNSKESEKYMGVCQLNGQSIHRRIDIRIYPLEEWPTGLFIDQLQKFDIIHSFFSAFVFYRFRSF